MEEQHMPGWVRETIMGQHPSFGAGAPITNPSVACSQMLLA